MLKVNDIVRLKTIFEVERETLGRIDDCVRRILGAEVRILREYDGRRTGLVMDIDFTFHNIKPQYFLQTGYTIPVSLITQEELPSLDNNEIYIYECVTARVGRQKSRSIVLHPPEGFSINPFLCSVKDDRSMSRLNYVSLIEGTPLNPISRVFLERLKASNAFIVPFMQDLMNKAIENTERELGEVKQEEIDLNVFGFLKIEDREAVKKEMISKVNTNSFKAMLDDRGWGRKADALLAMWAESKLEWYLLFGRQLRYDVEIEREPDTSEIRRAVRGIFNKEEHRQSRWIWNREVLMEKDFRAGKVQPREGFSLLHVFASHDIIPSNFAGMKVGRAINRLSTAENKDKLIAEISQLYQVKKRKEILGFTIDPVDFLTQSVNNSNWSSCHAFSGGMCWEGPLDYLIDKPSLQAIVYDGKISNVKFNDNLIVQATNKKMRQMIYGSITSSYTYFSLMYPYSDNKLAKTIRNEYEKLYCEKTGLENKWLKGSDTEPLNKVGEKHYADYQSRFVSIKHKDMTQIPASLEIGGYLP